MAGLPILWKGVDEHRGKGVVLLPAGSYKDVFIADSSGKRIASGVRFGNHTPEPGDKGGEFGIKYNFGSPGGAYGQGFLIGVTTPDGKTVYTKIDNGNGTYRGHVDPGEGSLDHPAELAQTGGGASGVPNGMQPGQVGSGNTSGFFPADISSEFPKPVLGEYNPITKAPYTFTDVMNFAKQFGDFNRSELAKNADFSQGLALKELDTELAGLKQFTPAAAALKRSETSIDNMFNQSQRTQQVDTALPGVRGQLNAQAGRAESYANGRIPDPIQDRALELGIRSNAADQGYVGGFGAGSSANQKASNLMSAAERVKLSQYGDQLLSNNITQKQNLLLAPTEYSNAGEQISVKPEVGGAQLMQNAFGQTNQSTLVQPGQALSDTIQQNQFDTNLEQQTRTFNATNQLSLSEFNANTQNQFAMDLFGYKSGLATSVASAFQTNANTQLQVQMQQQVLQVQMMMQQQAQSMQQIQSLFEGGLGLLTNASKIVDGIDKGITSVGKHCG